MVAVCRGDELHTRDARPAIAKNLFHRDAYVALGQRPFAGIGALIIDDACLAIDPYAALSFEINEQHADVAIDENVAQGIEVAVTAVVWEDQRPVINDFNQ